MILCRAGCIAGLIGLVLAASALAPNRTWADPPEDLRFRVMVSYWDGEKLVRYNNGQLQVVSDGRFWGRFNVVDHGYLEFTVPFGQVSDWTLILNRLDPSHFTAWFEDGFLRLACTDNDHIFRLPYLMQDDGTYCFEYYCSRLYICNRAEAYAPIMGPMSRDRRIRSAAPGPGAKAVAAGWTVTQVDNTGNSGQYSSIALDSNQAAHIGYWGDAGGGAEGAYHATNASGAWATEQIQAGVNVGPWGSLAVDSSDRVHAIYVDTGGNGLQYALKLGGAWATAVTGATANYQYNSLTVDSGGSAHVSSTDTGGGGLRYVSNSFGGGWTTDDQVSVQPPYLPYTGIAVDSASQIHIAVYNDDVDELWYYYGTKSSWANSSVDASSADVGSYCAIALDSGGSPHFSYRDAAGQRLKYATGSPGSWTTTTIPDNANVGTHTDIAMDSNGAAHISYNRDVADSIGYATNASGSWAVTIIDDTLSAEYTSIAVDCCGNPHISFYNPVASALYYATTGSCPGCPGGGGRNPGGPCGYFGGGGNVVHCLFPSEVTARFNQARRDGTDLTLSRVFPFSFGTDPPGGAIAPGNAAMPGLLFRWTGPDGISQTWFMALDLSGVLSNGINWTTALIKNYDVWCVDLRLVLPRILVAALAGGDHTLTYCLVDTDGAKANPRWETLTLE